MKVTFRQDLPWSFLRGDSGQLGYAVSADGKQGGKRQDGGRAASRLW